MEKNKDRSGQEQGRKNAMRFILLLGLVSLLGDVVYEGARSITGPFMAVLGASATAVGVVAGLGELVGYALRLFSGILTDKTGKYWVIAFTGYIMTFLAVPLLALAGSWQVAALLVIAERFGKAIRTPARDAMLSHATSEVGRGWGFAVHEALDQVGALLGPLLIAAVMYFRGSYRSSFAVLFIPAVMAILVLVTARVLYPSPRDLERERTILQGKGLPRAFWLYLAATALLAAGYADFALVAFHFKKASLFSDQMVPLLYAFAMGIDAIAALIFGRLFDRIGINSLIISAILSALFAPLVFLGGSGLAVAGMAVWGIGMAAQESVLRATISEMVPANKRGTAYGIFNTGYGLFWFLGSSLMGFLYESSIPTLVIFSVVVQLAAVPVLITTREQLRGTS
ncbi:MFS-1 transporter [Thermacetogenium phaeum DSM 12270]|uniref:MFS-1 transporter n=1 Tax=Thermacetogenium phaeum (strain ATCC BAA-254 / DSM 26808 / PB) TaxID=1089553 RepID=K4LIS4_THEPS|nr:MFS transporter [Thermacetogenium phaeum]AFV12891.1 MFS-1 transporter [Thermacetogenium phaeum DSM 12270]